MKRRKRRTAGYITDPEAYLKGRWPELDHKFLSGHTVSGHVRNYEIDPADGNACVSYAAAAVTEYYTGDFSKALELCRNTAGRKYGLGKNGANRLYIPLGCAAPFIRKCLESLGLGMTARSTLLAVRAAKSEIDHDRPALLNIAYSPQYRDHTVVAYGWAAFRSSGGRGTGKVRLFFRVRDGYTGTEDRWVCSSEIAGLFTTRIFRAHP